MVSVIATEGAAAVAEGAVVPVVAAEGDVVVV